MKKNQNGFSVVEVLVVIVVLGLLVAIGKFAFDRMQNKNKDSGASTSQQEQASVNKKPIKSIGFNLDSYNQATGMAGDMKFTKGALYDKYLFGNFGKVPENVGPDGQKKGGSPQVMFLLPMGTKVQAIADGTIYDVKQLYSGDYSVMIDVGDPELYYEMEHVSNVTVKKGDKVTAGQKVAEVSSHNSKNNDGLGILEVGVLKHGNPPSHNCFFDHVDDSFKAELDKKILAFYKSWEAYKGDTTIYDEANMPTPGCDTREPISDNNDYRKQN